MMAFSSYQLYLAYAGFACLLTAYVVYRLSVPKPIPGIPYSKASIRPFGDIPAMLKSVNESKDANLYIHDKAQEMGVPVFQIFLAPFGKPWVIVADSAVTEDILLHRVHEFERSSFFTALFIALVPNSMMMYKTKDPVWKLHRRLMADTMSNRFLHGAAGPHIQEAVQAVVRLWTMKERLSQGRPFDILKDTVESFADSTWAAAFGEPMELISTQTSFLSKYESLPQQSGDVDSPITFPIAATPKAAEYILALADSIQIVTKNPFRDWAHRFILLVSPHLRKATAYKNRFIGEKLKEAEQRISTSSGNTVKCVADLLAEKEILLAKREDRVPVIDSPMVRDELMTFFLGAFDTTGTTVQWAMKYFTKYQDVQDEVRKELKAAFGNSRSPKTVEIAYAKLPYLDAFIYEILRMGATSPGSGKMADVDVVILGYKIPKGTEIVFPLQGPGYLSPRTDPVSDVKSPWTGNWNPKELHLFRPSRWLIEHDGELKFDPKAGPMHGFGLGIRACFGKRLALLGLRIFLATILLNFELQPIPEELNNFKAETVLTRHPQMSYIRPKSI